MPLSHGASVELPEGYEGALKPLDNIHDIERIVPPMPGSPHNREQRHPMPDRTFKQWLLSENAGAPTPAVPMPDDPRLVQIRDAVQRLDAAHGRVSDGSSERLVAGLYAQVVGNPALRRVDEVVLNEQTATRSAGSLAFAVYRPHGANEPAFHAAVDVKAALATPADEHFRRAQEALQAQAFAQGRTSEIRQPTAHVL